MSLKFENPTPISKDEAAAILSGGDKRRIVDCLVALALGESDVEFVWQAIRRFVDDADPGVRGVAVLCIGHMARIHKRIPSDWARAAIARALKDPNPLVSGQAENADDDVRMFVGRR